MSLLIRRYAATGTAYFQSLDASLSFSGGLTKQVNIPLTGGLSFSGALSRQVNIVLAGSLSFAGVLSRQINVVLDGVLNLAGSLGKGSARVLAGVLGFAGDLISLFIPAGSGPSFFQMLRQKHGGWRRRRGK